MYCNQFRINGTFVAYLELKKMLENIGACFDRTKFLLIIRIMLWLADNSHRNVILALEKMNKKITNN